mgnify:CR=1 FL=1
MVDDLKGCLAFIKKVGWPVVVKPDNGVGASDTHKLSSETELGAFLARRMEGVPYIMEEFIHAEVNSYDAIMGMRSTIFRFPLYLARMSTWLRAKGLPSRRPA